MCGQRQEEGNKNKTGSLNRKKMGLNMMEHPPGYINRRVCESVCVYYTERSITKRATQQTCTTFRR